LGVKNAFFFVFLGRKRPSERIQISGRDPVIFASHLQERGEEIVRPERLKAIY
jgi:hypothetical protein